MQRFRKQFILILLSLSSCLPVPNYETETPSESCGCETVAREALGLGEFEIGDWPRRDWWNEFDDPVLTKLIEEALKLSPTLKRAEASLKAAYEVAYQKRARLFPEIDFTGNDNWQHLSKDGFYREYAPVIPAVVNDITFGLSYYYEFDFWGKNRDLFKAALGMAAAMAAEKMQAELILTTSIAYTYSQLQLLLYKRSLLERYEMNNQAIHDIRVKRGVNAIDTTVVQLQARSNTLDAQAPILQIDEQIRNQIHKIKALTGLGQDAAIEIPCRAVRAIQVCLPENLSLDLVARRPDLIAQKARLEAAAKEIGAARTDFYPNFNLMGLIGFESVFWNKLLKTTSYSGNFQPAVHLPIFTAGRIKAQLMEKVDQFNQTVFAYEEMILLAAQEIADSLAAIRRLQSEIEVRSSSLTVAEQQEKLTQRRLQYAIDDRMALLESQNAVLSTKIELSDLEYGKQLANIILIRGLGGGYCGLPE
jgi:NodT family efflux transporter outer membrane factor (OMF) lipoprotein